GAPAAVTAAPGRTTGDAGPAAGHFGRPTGCPAVCEGPGAAGPYPRSAASATRRAPPGEAVPRVRAGAPPKAGGPGTPVPPGLRHRDAPAARPRPGGRRRGLRPARGVFPGPDAGAAAPGGEPADRTPGAGPDP